MLDWFDDIFRWLRDFMRRLMRKLSGCGTASVSITPTSGPAGTIATINVLGLLSGDPIAVVIGPGTHATPGADSSGNASIAEIIVGEPNEVVSISVITGSGICEETTVLRFMLTN